VLNGLSDIGITDDNLLDDVMAAQRDNKLKRTSSFAFGKALDHALSTVKWPAFDAFIVPANVFILPLCVTQRRVRHPQTHEWTWVIHLVCHFLLFCCIVVNTSHLTPIMISHVTTITNNTQI
jgi:hypothetical protein